ncbi:MAG: hypothetical protein U5K37_06140 [Natrialbaceae archaeon]|nr:hypothetical protein [Natrialbaceae archaeon]
MLFDSIGPLDIEIEDYTLSLREAETTSDFTRTTTVAALEGPEEVGRGEDVIYDEAPHHSLTATDNPVELAGEYTIESFSAHLASIDLFPDTEPTSEIFRQLPTVGLRKCSPRSCPEAG